MEATRRAMEATRRRNEEEAPPDIAERKPTARWAARAWLRAAGRGEREVERCGAAVAATRSARDIFTKRMTSMSGSYATPAATAPNEALCAGRNRGEALQESDWQPQQPMPVPFQSSVLPQADPGQKAEPQRSHSELMGGPGSQ